MEEEIKSKFEESGFVFDGDEADILKKCIVRRVPCSVFCSLANGDGSVGDMVSSWEVYYLNRVLNETVIRNAEMNGFLLHLQNEVREAVIKEEPNLHVYSERDVNIAYK